MSRMRHSRQYRCAYMKRRLLNVLALLSALLCLTVLADWCSHAWGQSYCGYHRERTENRDRVSEGAGIYTGNGVILVGVLRLRQPEAPSQDMVGAVTGYH